MDAAERVLDLQVRYMHLEKLVEQLNEVVTAQQDTLDSLTRQVRALREQAGPGTADPDGDPPPPHY